MLNRNQIIRFCLLVSALVVVHSCKPTRDRWINRKWHTLTGHYNVYFNGETKFNDAVRNLEKTYPNDFSKILPVLIIPDEATAKGMSGTMDEVIKKSSLAIQNHTVGSYTDDSYFLMARANFYKRDFFAALEAFQYINSKYKEGDLNKISMAWVARCYTGLNKIGEAEAVMGLLISEIAPTQFKGKKKVSTKLADKAQKISKAQRSEVYATAADIYVRQEKYGLAADRLKTALQYTTVKEKKIRYHYILGQLYLQLDSMPQAKEHFNKVTTLLAPYDFEFNANLNLTRIYNPDNKAEVKRVKRNLKRMLRDDKNEGLFDQVHYELARVEYRDKNIPAAIKNYKLSILKSTRNQNQKAFSYLALGNIYLDMPDYMLAQAYYDSAATSISKDYKDYQKIVDKRQVLSELISNYKVIETEDSLQQLSKLSQAELEKKIDGWILAEKQAKDRKVAEEKAQKEAAKNAPPQTVKGGPPPLIGAGGTDAQWYFYNSSIVASGAQDFASQRKWGQRANEDFWRIAAREKERSADGSAPGGQTETSKEGEKEKEKQENAPETADAKANVSSDRQAWVKDIPYSAEDRKKSNARLLTAYYNIGVIYDEKLADQKEAAKNYELMLARYPDNEYEPEVLYRLYKIYTTLKNQTKADDYRSTLIRKYPESTYALIVQNKAVLTAESDANKEVTKTYEQLYGLYTTGRYAEVKTGKHAADKKYPGNSMQAKFDLLYAMAVGRTDSVSVFRSELEYITKTYPKTDVSETAQSILEQMKKQGQQKKDTVAVASADFEIGGAQPAPHYYIFATKADKFDMNELLGKLMTYNGEYHQFENLKANSMLSNEGYQLLLVREFPSIDKAVQYQKGLELVQYFQNHIPQGTAFFGFTISVDNFKKMLKEQKVDAYYKQYQQKYPELLKNVKQ